MAELLGNSLEACIGAWRNRLTFANEVGSEEIGDGHFSRGDLEGAAATYTACELQSERISAKRGWCLAVSDRCEEAAQFLTRVNCGESSAELAVLAATISGGWNRNKLIGGYGAAADEVRARRETVEDLVRRALDEFNPPDQLAFHAYMDLVEWYRDREAALEVAERATSLFKVPAFFEWHARLLRTLGRPNDAVYDALLQHVPAKPWTMFVQEMFESALVLSRYEDASDALELLEPTLTSEPQRLDTRLALLRCYVDLRRALDADPGAAARGLAIASQVHIGLMGVDDANDLLLFAAKLRLALAVLANDEVSIRDSSKSIADVNWAANTAPDHSPSCELMMVECLHFGAEFGEGFRAPSVPAALAPEDQFTWTMLNALRSVSDGVDPEGHAHDFIVQYGLRHAPAWAAETVADVFLSCEAPQARNAGRAIARHCKFSIQRYEKYAYVPELEYSALTSEQLGEMIEGFMTETGEHGPETTQSGQLLLSALGPHLTKQNAHEGLQKIAELILARVPEDTDALFYAAFAHQKLNELVPARTQYERLLALDADCRSAYWNVTLIYEGQGNVEAIEKLLPAIEERAEKGEQDWVKTRDQVHAALRRARQQQSRADFRAFVRRELGTFPALRNATIAPGELSLLESACLLALLRAGDLDHSTLILAPFASSAVPFEPTNRFRATLLGLATKGVIEIADSTPLEAFTARDGELRYYLDRVRWRIGSLTLALQHEIRDLTPAKWPAHWTAHAEVLSRDLATEECVAYMEYLAEQRNLTPPEQADARAVFRELLEHCSVGQCWYYIYSGVQSANDYRTKYPVSQDKVTAMMLKRARERGEIAIAKGWATSYSRIRALPRSHLSAALHDVLTGWSERAFEEPIRALAHPDAFRPEKSA